MSDGSSAYYIGGFYSLETSTAAPSTNRIPSSGLLEFDFDTLIMTNSSDDDYPADMDDPPATMINIPYGESGLLLFLGDNSKLRNAYAFNNHILYDKKVKKWYSQIAFGDIPEPRSHFCAVGVAGTANSSFEM